MWADCCLRCSCVGCLAVTAPLGFGFGCGLHSFPVDLASCGLIIVVGLIVLVICCGVGIWLRWIVLVL